MQSITATSPDDVWAVGLMGSGARRNLAEHYFDPSVRLPPTPALRPPPSTSTSTSSQTSTTVPMSTETWTSTPTIVSTSTSTATPTACTIQFQDASPGSTFYPYVRCLACRGTATRAILAATPEPCVPPNNYPYLRPNSDVTRGQLSKIVSEAAEYEGCCEWTEFPGRTAGEHILALDRTARASWRDVRLHVWKTRGTLRTTQ